MDVVLKVLEGAKVGTKIAVKKEKFLIGRSQKCHLCAGSTSVSRKHCVIKRDGAIVSIQDLGSRNGTLVNEKKIAGEVPLSSGDEIAVGPLRFLVTITPGISNQKRPQVKSVADAVDRTAATADSSIGDDDITQWLLESDPLPKATTETQPISMDDTNAIEAQKIAKEHGDPESILAEDSSKETDTPGSDHFKSKAKKKAPGKLPPISKTPASKDSREAASAALRNWSRRS